MAYMNGNEVLFSPIVSAVAGITPDSAVEYFANALKGEAIGEIVALDDVTPFPANIKVRVGGKNLCPTSTLSVGGTNAYRYISLGAVSLVKGKEYTISANFEQIGADISTVQISVRRASNIANVISETEASAKSGKIVVVFTVPPEEANIVVLFYSNLSAQALTTSCIFSNIQIEEGSTATEYEPYIAGNEVGTAVTIKTCGKNLIPYPYKESATQINGLTFTHDGRGKIIVNGTATKTTYYILSDTGSNSKLNVLPKNAVLSGCPNGGSDSTYQITTSNPDGTSMADVGNGVQLSKGFSFRDIYIHFGKGVTVNNLIFAPMLEFGTTATEFEPYIEGETIATAIGENIELSPIAQNMTISTDEARACLSVKYNKDTNRVIEKLIQAIISLGGNL